MSHPASILRKESLFAGKELGQNFIVDSASARRIVDRSGIKHTDTILEIGAGLGALTRCCAPVAEKVVAIEKDSRLIPILKREIAGEGLGNVHVVHADFLKLDIRKYAETKKLVIMGNLPYNISSQILIKLISERRYIKKAVLMFQKEVAQRISALPGSRDYSRLSAVIQYCASVTDIVDMKPACFFPKPDVDSRVVLIMFHDVCVFDYRTEAFHFEVIKAAFSKRRKTLKNALSSAGLPVSQEGVTQALDVAGIDPQRRAETVNPSEFILLTKQLTVQRGDNI